MNEQEKRNAVLTVLKSQIGVSESPAGTNKVKYNKWFYGVDVQDGYDLKGNKNPKCFYPWCATFISWGFSEGSIPLGNIGYLKGFAGCETALAKIDKWGKFVEPQNAKPGDIIFFDWKCDGKPDHVGIIEGINTEKKMFITIEGNTAIGNDSNGGSVMRRERVLFKGIKIVRPNVYN